MTIEWTWQTNIQQAGACDVVMTDAQACSVNWSSGNAKVSKIICLMHLSMLCPWGRGSGKEWGFDVFLKIFDKIHSLGTKSLVKNHKNPHPGADPSTLHNTTHALISITDSVPCPTWWITITAYPMHLFNITY